VRGPIEMTIPDKPNSHLQQYRLTEQGKVVATMFSWWVGWGELANPS
tara:strand:+ start:50 stop:190 length:141 start_codon:yes stop_codon:yes gene_type:complete